MDLPLPDQLLLEDACGAIEKKSVWREVFLVHSDLVADQCPEPKNKENLLQLFR